MYDVNVDNIIISKLGKVFDWVFRYIYKTISFDNA